MNNFIENHKVVDENDDIIGNAGYNIDQDAEGEAIRQEMIRFFG